MVCESDIQPLPYPTPSACQLARVVEAVAASDRNQRNNLAIFELAECQLDPLAVFGTMGSVAVQLAVHGFCKLLKSLKKRE